MSPINVTGFHDYFPVAKMMPASLYMRHFSWNRYSRVHDGSEWCKDEKPVAAQRGLLHRCVNAFICVITGLVSDGY